MRLYNEKDNTQTYTFTDVLDAAYNNVYLTTCSGSHLNTTTPCSSAPSSMPSNQSGPYTTPMKKDHFLPSLEENTPSGDTPPEKKGSKLSI